MMDTTLVEGVETSSQAYQRETEEVSLQEQLAQVGREEPQEEPMSTIIIICRK